MRLRVLLVDPGSLTQTADITTWLTSDSTPEVSTSLSDKLYATGRITLASSSTPPMGQLVRIVLDDIDGTSAVLGTFFAAPSSVQRVENLVITELELSSTLLALESARLITTYVATNGALAQDIIQELSKLAGRSCDMSGITGNARYGSALFYDPGTPLIDIATEAAELAEVRLITDELGAISVMSMDGTGATHTLTNLPSMTTLLEPIDKGASGLNAPNRATAIFQGDDDTMLTASTSLVGSLDAMSRGRWIDISVELGSMTQPSAASLMEVAERSLRDAQQVAWSVETTFEGIRAGDTVKIHDTDAGETLVGIAQSVDTTLGAIATQKITVRGTVQ